MIGLTVLGACGTYPAAGRACSGYLVEASGPAGEARVWVDTGPGTLANLLRVASLPDLDGIWVSHLHVNHVGDLPITNYALRYGEWEPSPAPVPVFGPPGWAGHVARFLATGDADPVAAAFDVHDLRDGERIGLGPLTLEAVATVHGIETYGVRVAAGGATVAYSADSGPCDGLGRLAEGADLFVCEAAWPTWPDGAEPIHMTPELAGRWAAEAGAGRLLLTHLRPGTDVDAATARAADAYGGSVELATELRRYQIGDHREQT